jgi:hypothetical protein
MAKFAGHGADGPRRITVIDLGQLHEREVIELEELFGDRKTWPVFVWNGREWELENTGRAPSREHP